MLKPLIVFYVSKPNVYSFAKLLSIIEHNSEVLAHYDIITLRSSLYKAKPSTLHHYKISERPFVILPVSLMSAQNSDFIYFVSKKLTDFKRLNPNLIILVGGWNASGDPEGTLKMGADYVITGEAENAFPEFLLNFIKNPIHLPKIFSNKDPVDLEQYPPFSEKFRVFCPIEISRGCPFRCKFCQT